MSTILTTTPCVARYQEYYGDALVTAVSPNGCMRAMPEWEARYRREVLGEPLTILRQLQLPLVPTNQYSFELAN